MTVGSGHQATVAPHLAGLPSDEWSVLGNVVVGPAGVFVIVAKGWSGNVEVRDGVLRHEGRARGLTVADATDAASDVAHLVPDLPDGVVQPVLCFVRAERLIECASGVLVCSTAGLLDTLMLRSRVLACDDVRRISAALEHELRLVGHPQPVATVHRPRREPTVLERAAARWAWSALLSSTPAPDARSRSTRRGSHRA